jgi:hypothetical protein
MVEVVRLLCLWDGPSEIIEFWPQPSRGRPHVVTRAKPAQAHKPSPWLAAFETVAHADTPDLMIPRNSPFPQTYRRRLNTIRTRRPRVPEAVPASRSLLYVWQKTAS